jgi:hypothetical protein
MGIKYRPDEGICCSGIFYQIFPNSENRECCGPIPYNPYKFVCREGNLIPIIDE